MNEPLLTKHAVRNLNGPRMDGRCNGRRQSCAHFKDPHLPTFPAEQIVGVKLVRGHYCSLCGELRFTDAED